LNSYQTAEKTLFLIDQAAKYSAYDAAVELADNGGFYDTSDCGDYLEYQLLYDAGKECYPGNIRDEFILNYNDNLEGRLSGAGIIPVSFVYTILTNSPLKIVGANKDMLEFPIASTYETPIQKTQICPMIQLEDVTDVFGKCELTKSSCQLTPDAAAALRKAQQIAKQEGYELQLTSGYRTIQQQATMKQVKGDNAAGASCTAPHVTGGAVDIVIKGQPYMTSSGYPVADMSLGNRQALEDIMCQAGFVRFKGEFWHYEYGTGRWERGKQAGVCAII
jgi:hypothetical protein